MLKIFAIITVLGGQVIAVQGPLPMTLEECKAFSQQINAQNAPYQKSGFAQDGTRLSDLQKTVKFDCVAAKERPKITYDENTISL